MQHFDLAIIGSGSGNSLFTEELRHLNCALIEESTFGGTCLNVGCIPTKMFVYSATVAHIVADSERFGIVSAISDVRWREIRDRIFERIDPISAGGRRYRESNDQVTLFGSHAEFVDAHTLRLSTGEHLTADRIVVAAGSRAVVPPFILDSAVKYYTSDTIMRIDSVPNRMTIIGGGYIAAEFAHVFSSLGSAVTVLLRGDRMLREADVDISARFTELASQKWDVRFNCVPQSLTDSADGIRATLADGSTVDADVMLVATGRVPNSDHVNAVAAGLALHSDGRIVVDEYQRSSVEGIWALGDVSSKYQLKHVANANARVVAHNLAHPDQLTTSRQAHVPYAVFSNPQIASVGMTETQAQAMGHRIQVLVQNYSGTAYGWAMQDTTSFCKLVVESSTGRLLGAHILGDEASTLIQPLIQAMEFGQSVADVAHGQYWIHPALTEVIENALLQFTPKIPNSVDKL